MYLPNPHIPDNHCAAQVPTYVPPPTATQHSVEHRIDFNKQILPALNSTTAKPDQRLQRLLGILRTVQKFWRCSFKWRPTKNCCQPDFPLQKRRVQPRYQPTLLERNPFPFVLWWMTETTYFACGTIVSTKKERRQESNHKRDKETYPWTPTQGTLGQITLT